MEFNIDYFFHKISISNFNILVINNAFELVYNLENDYIVHDYHKKTSIHINKDTAYLKIKSTKIDDMVMMAWLIDYHGYPDPYSIVVYPPKKLI